MKSEGRVKSSLSLSAFPQSREATGESFSLKKFCLSILFREERSDSLKEEEMPFQRDRAVDSNENVEDGGEEDKEEKKEKKEKANFSTSGRLTRDSNTLNGRDIYIVKKSRDLILKLSWQDALYFFSLVSQGWSYSTQSQLSREFLRKNGVYFLSKSVF